MGQCTQHVFVCSIGKSCSKAGGEIVDDLRYIAPPGDSKIDDDE